MHAIVQLMVYCVNRAKSVVSSIVLPQAGGRGDNYLRGAVGPLGRGAQEEPGRQEGGGGGRLHRVEAPVLVTPNLSCYEPNKPVVDFRCM